MESEFSSVQSWSRYMQDIKSDIEKLSYNLKEFNKIIFESAPVDIERNWELIDRT